MAMNKSELDIVNKDLPIIELKNVAVRFGNTFVHKDINLKMTHGESLTLLGPSGIGKTLILKLIVGLLKPSAGQVNVLGKNIAELNDEELRQIRRNIGMLFQGAALFDSLNVFDNIAYPLREYRTCPESELDKIVEEKLEIIGLPGIGQKYPSQLSGGQKKRVGLARALASSPQILLFDEPTTGLDPTATRLIDELIIRLNQEYNITCLSVTHDIASAKRISARWALVNKGTIVADGPRDRICEENSDVLDFITGNWKSELQCA